jgi:hypothetical protein
MLEFVICLLVFGVMGFVAVRSDLYAQRHLHAMEALSLMSGARATMMEYRAVRGTWPTSNRQAGFADAMLSPSDRDQYGMNSVQIREGGAIDVAFVRGPLKGKVVSIRASERPAAGLPVEWTCGYAATPPNTTSPPDHTTIADSDLPSPCRSRK